jgi:hypothetical protein
MIIENIKYLLKFIIWFFRGRKMIHYSGYNCGCCGTWVKDPFSIPEYKSISERDDTWGICKRGTGCDTKSIHNLKGLSNPLNINSTPKILKEK